MSDKKVYTCFCTDIIHEGHLNIINKAKELGSVTVGVLCDSEMVRYNRFPQKTVEEKIEMIKAIPVYLEAPGNPAAYASARKVLQNEEAVNISPEAARNYTDQILLPFKTGAVRLARETDTLILPYCIVGDYRFLSKNLKIVFGTPLAIDEDVCPRNVARDDELAHFTDDDLFGKCIGSGFIAEHSCGFSEDSLSADVPNQMGFAIVFDRTEDDGR